MARIDGQRLRQERKRQGYKAGAFVKRLETSGTWTVKHLLNVEGGWASCSEEFMNACADVLGIDPRDLDEQVPA